MKVLNYKQLCKAPADTLFATLNKMNELGEVLVLGEYPDGRRFIYSPLADVSSAGTKEVEFDENAFNRAGTFVVFEKAEIKAMCEKFQGIVNFQEPAPTNHLSLLKSEVRASIEEEGLHTETSMIVPVFSRESARHFVDTNLLEPINVIHNDVEFQTSAMAIGAHYSLLGISQTQSLLDTGMLDMTDSIDSDIRLKKIYVRLEALGLEDEVIAVDVLRRPSSQGVFPPNSQRQVQILFREDVALIASMETVTGAASKILTNGWVLPKVVISGSVNLELADTQFSAQRLESFHQHRNDLNVRVRVIGYTLDAKRVNHNRRPRLAA